MNFKDLVKVANRLDNLGLTKEADLIDRLIFKIGGDTSFADGVVRNLKTVSDMITSTQSKNFWPDSPLENTIRNIAGSSGPTMSPAEIVTTLTSSYDNTIGTGAYNRLSPTERMAFQSIIVKPLLDNVAGRRGKSSAPSESGVAMMEGSAYPKPSGTSPAPKSPSTPGTPSPKRTTSKPAVKRDWSYYNSVVKDPVGQKMEMLWARAAPLLGKETDYDSFRSWYKSKGKDMNTLLSAREMFSDAILKSSDPMITRVRDSRAKSEDVMSNKALYTYLGLNYETGIPSTGAERFAASQRLSAISKAMEDEESRFSEKQFDDEEEFKFDGE